MPKIYLETYIEAPIERVFNLSRSIDLHKISTSKHQEQAIAGTTKGLIGLGETVTWRAKHLGLMQELTSKIVGYEFPTYFADIQLKGAFKSFKHEHFFEETKEGSVLKDVFDYTSPLWILGKLADTLFLKKYMTHFLTERNTVIKEYAETEKWKEILL